MISSVVIVVLDVTVSAAVPAVVVIATISALDLRNGIVTLRGAFMLPLWGKGGKRRSN